MQAWSNHQFISVPDQASVSQISPGFSLFETFALRAGKVETPDFHEHRLIEALKHLNLDETQLHLNFSDKIHHWSPILKNLLLAEKLTDAIVRWIVVPHQDGTLTEWVTLRPLPPTPPSVDLFLLNTIRDKAEWLPRPKSGPWQNSQAALNELKKISSSFDIEGIQLDEQGNLSDGTRSALAWWDGTDWLTPSYQTQCLSSTTLQALQRSFSDDRKIKATAQPFPQNAKSLIILRSTFAGGAVIVNKVFSTDGKLIWTAPSNQDEARIVLCKLKEFRTQRSVSLL